MDDDMFSLGEPTKVGSRQGLLEEWEMRAYGQTYRVVVARADRDDEYFVMLSGTDSDWDAEKRWWSTMRGGRTGGIVTAEFIRSNYHFSEQSSRYLAVLVASALGRPYEVRAVATEVETPA